jgi:GTPase SAR1 family protein
MAELKELERWQEADRAGWMCRATEMDITMIGLQNAGKTSLLRVLAVGSPISKINSHPANPR